MAVVEAKTNSPDADFWLQRSGSVDKVGRPKRSYAEYDIGITVLDKSIILPDYLYYWFLNVYNKRYWEQFSYGSLPLKHIRVEDVRQLLDYLTGGNSTASKLFMGDPSW